MRKQTLNTHRHRGQLEWKHRGNEKQLKLIKGNETGEVGEVETWHRRQTAIKVKQEVTDYTEHIPLKLIQKA